MQINAAVNEKHNSHHDVFQIFFFYETTSKCASLKGDHKYVCENFYPGIPSTPKARDGGRSPMSGKMYGAC